MSLLLLLLSLLLLHPSARAADDVSPLETLYQQQAQVLQQVQAELRALSSTVASMQKTVAFSAHMSPGLVTVSNSNAPIPYNVVTTNIGDSYNPATGIFTVPFSGVYFLALHLLHDADSTHGYINVAVASDRQELCRATINARDSAGIHDQGACQTAVHLTAGQQVFARRVSGDVYLHGDIYNFFTGFLLSADSQA